MVVNNSVTSRVRVKSFCNLGAQSMGMQCTVMRNVLFVVEYEVCNIFIIRYPNAIPMQFMYNVYR